MTTHFDHADYLEQIPAYLAGGLTAPERAALETHIAACPSCAAALHDAARADQFVKDLFSTAQPMAGFEDRVIQSLRQARSRRILHLHPAVLRTASGIAAALVLGSVGYVANNLIQSNKLPGIAPFAMNVESSQRSKDVSPQGDRDGALPSVRRQLNESERFDGSGHEAGAASEKLADSLGRQVAPASDGQTSERRYVQSKKVGLSIDPKPSSGNAQFELVRGLPVDLDGDGDLDIGGAGRVTLGTLKYTQADANNLTSLYRWSSPQPESATSTDYYAGYAVLDTKANAPQDPAQVDERRSKGVAVGGTVNTAISDPSTLFGVASGAGGAMGGGGIGGVNAGGAVLAGRANQRAQQHMYFRPAEQSDVLARGEIAAQKVKNLGEVERVRAGVALADGDRNAPAEPKAPVAGKPAVAGDTVVQAGQFTQPVQAEQQQAPVINRKIIRNGEMEFEVDNFDSSFVQVSKIVTEDGGFVSSTSSEKLPNGKVRGTIVVRIPPDRLDTFVLKLRALGDLKNQRISAQDVTKQYNDLESELKAARAMEERLLNIIKSGKGEIKDLLEAEKQLGVYREKIEKLEGEIRYYNNLVSLSTLAITLTERDIRAAAFAQQSEQVSAGIETEEVEKARADALKAIEEAKGRVVESNLKKYDAGQLAATIVAEITPDAAGPLIDRLKQLGHVARLDIERKQTTPSGTAPATGRIERKDTRFAISIYNLANIAPRQSSALNLAVSNVEEAYKAILESIKTKAGRIVTSNLNRQKPEQTTATIGFEVPSAEADAILAEIRRERDVLSLTVTENPDTNNVTAAKRGFNVQIQSLATVPPRESEQQVLAAKARVAEAYKAILDELKKADARVLVAQLNQQDQNGVTGQLDFEILRTKEIDLRTALGNQAYLISRSSTQSSDAANTVDSKIRLQLRLLSLDRIAPRETFNLGMASKDVPASYQALLATLKEQGAHIRSSQLNEQDPQNISAGIDFEVLREKREAAEKALAAAGVVYARSVTKASDPQNSVDLKVRMVLSLMDVERVAPRETVRMSMEVDDVDRSVADLTKAIDNAAGRIVDSTQSTAGNGQVSSHIIIDVPLSKAGEIRQQIKALGDVKEIESSKNPNNPAGDIARAQFDVTLTSPDVNQGMWAAVKRGWGTSITGLLWSLQLVVIGLFLIAPVALVLWGAWKLLRRKPAARTV